MLLEGLLQLPQHTRIGGSASSTRCQARGVNHAQPDAQHLACCHLNPLRGTRKCIHRQVGGTAAAAATGVPAAATAAAVHAQQAAYELRFAGASQADDEDLHVQVQR